MTEPFMDTKTLITIIHLLGVAFGVGGAFMSDLMFFRTVKDKEISKTEMDFLHLGSILVWTGLFLLVASGVALFFLDPQYYLNSSKFLAKMSIVGILIINGVLLHIIQIPLLKRHIGHHFPSSDEFIRKRLFLLGSGVVSMVSWVSALILGALRNVPYSYQTIMTIYAILVLFGLFVSFLLRDKIIPMHKKSR